MIENKPVVYAIEGLKKNGCNFYRIHQPYLKILHENIFPCALSTELGNVDDQALWTDKADLIVTQIGTSEKFLEYVLEQKGKKKFILDFDDNIFEVSPYNPAYKDCGIREVEVDFNGEKRMLWKDGQDGFDLKRNRNRLFIFRETIKAVDCVTTPSGVLSGTFKQAGAKKTKVIRNFVDLDIWKKINIEKDGFIRIGYQGGWSHYQDWFVIEGLFEKIMERYKNVVLVLCGQVYETCLKNLPQDRIERQPWVSIDAYPYMFRTMNIDIGIAPLENNLFNTCKSEIKWEEYASLEIPCVASNIPPYSIGILDGRTGFLASNLEEWEKDLSNLIESKDLRIDIGRAARASVEDEYGLAKGVYQYRDLVEELFKTKIILGVA